MALSTDTNGTTNANNTWKNPAVLSHFSNRKLRALLNLKMGQGAPENPNFEPPGPSVFTTVPQMVEKTCKNEGAQHFLRISLFFRCAFFLKEKPFLKHDVSNDMHFGSMHWMMHMFFRMFTLFDPLQKGAQTKKGARNLSPVSKFRTSRPPKGIHSDRKKGAQKGTHSGFCVTEWPQSERATL